MIRLPNLLGGHPLRPPADDDHAVKCGLCGSEMTLRFGSLGPFHQCRRPTCGNTKLLTTLVPEAIYAASSGHQLEI